MDRGRDRPPPQPWAEYVLAQLGQEPRRRDVVVALALAAAKVDGVQCEERRAGRGGLASSKRVKDAVHSLVKKGVILRRGEYLILINREGS